jgi:Omp85 superfamily domain
LSLHSEILTERVCLRTHLNSLIPALTLSFLRRRESSLFLQSVRCTCALLRRWSWIIRQSILALIVTSNVLGNTLHDLPSTVRDSSRRLISSGAENKIVHLTSLLATHGYFNPSITEFGDSITLDPGKRALLSSIKLYGDTVFSIPVQTNYSDALVEQTLQGVVSRLSSSGYLYARVILDSLVFTGDSIVANCRLVRGALSVLGEVKLEGLERTNPSLLRKIIDIHEGDTVTTEMIATLEERLSGVTLIRFISPVEIAPREGFTAVDLVCRFAEIPQAELLGGLGYLPDDKSGLTWSGRAQLNNLFGSGKTLRIDSHRPQKNRNELDLAYSQPVFFGGFGNWGVSIGTRDYIGQFYEFQIRSRWDVMSRRGAILGGELGWKSVENESAPSFSAWSAGVRAEFRNVGTHNPQENTWRVATEFTSVYRRFRKDLAEVQVRNAFDTRTQITVDGFTNLFRSFGLDGGIGYRGLQTRDTIISPSELIYIGGPQSLRGYRTDQFAVVHAITGSLEPSISFASGRTGLFIDAGWLASRTLTSHVAVTDEQVRTGYGWFVRLIGESSSLQIGLAWNPDVRLNEPRLTLDLSGRL